MVVANKAEETGCQTRDSKIATNIDGDVVITFIR